MIRIIQKRKQKIGKRNEMREEIASRLKSEKIKEMKRIRGHEKAQEEKIDKSADKECGARNVTRI